MTSIVRRTRLRSSLTTLILGLGAAPMVACGADEGPPVEQGAANLTAPGPGGKGNANACRATSENDLASCVTCCDEGHEAVVQIIATATRCNDDCAATGGVLCFAPCQQASESACRNAAGACESYFACVDGCANGAKAGGR